MEEFWCKCCSKSVVISTQNTTSGLWSVSPWIDGCIVMSKWFYFMSFHQVFITRAPVDFSDDKGVCATHVKYTGIRWKKRTGERSGNTDKCCLCQKNKNIVRQRAQHHCFIAQPQTIANDSYSRFEDDNKIKYKGCHNHRKRKEYTEDTAPHVLHERKLR